MMCKSIRFLLAMLLLCVSLVLGGCMEIHMGCQFNADGSVDAKNTFTSEMPQLIEQFKSSAKEEGLEIQDIDKGFVATRHFSSVQDFVDNGDDMWRPEEADKGIFYRKGFLFDTYEVRLTVDGSDNDTGMGETGDDPQMQELAKQMMSTIKLDMQIDVPVKPDSHNASATNNDGRTLTWDLKNAILDNQPVDMQVKFRVMHDDSITMLKVGAAIAGILGVALLVLGIGGKGKPFVAFGIVLLLAGIAAGGYLYTSLQSAPELGNADKIVSTVPHAPSSGGSAVQ